jgi:hypothetical protein
MSTEKTINSTIRTNLLNNEDFLYAHLVKFERPFPKDSDTNTFGTEANRYAYYTDGSHDISYDDGSGNGAQVYRANRILSIGNYSETTQARASQMNLTLAGEDLKPALTMTATISNGGIVAPVLGNANLYEGYTLDFVEKGFKEGDRIRFKSSSIDKTFIIDSFLSNNTALQLARTGTDSNDDVFSNSGNGPWTITQESDEITAPLQERGITISGTSAASPNFINRSVMIYKVFTNPDTGLLWGSTGITIFKGVIQNVSIDEASTGVKVKWGLTSHWGDWQQVGGRLTTDEIHRNIQPNGRPAEVQPIRNEYASDLGFLHAESSLSAIANYTTQETRTKMKAKRRGGIAGLAGGKYYLQIPYQVDIQNEVDLNVHLQGKYLPVVYGVQRINGNPIFADTLNSDSKVIFTADAICEGEIHGLYNIYIDDIPLICTDDNDYDVRKVGGTDQDNTQLQCYGRMSHGETLMGKEGEPTEISGEPVEFDINDEGEIAIARSLAVGPFGMSPRVSSLINDWWSGAGALSAGTNGVLHRKSWSIDGIHKIDSSFFSGRANQLASSMLYNPAQLTDGIESVTVTSGGSGYTSNPDVLISAPSGGGVTATAEVQRRGNDNEGNERLVATIKITNKGSGYTDADTVTVTIGSVTSGGGSGARATANRGGYKRQVDYYEGSEPYWSSNHRLLDTAYSATRFEISPDATEIPEIEYVVKGSLLDCYNYDNTYVPDEVLNPASPGDITSRAGTFKIGDVIAVEYSTDGVNWTNDTSGLNANGKFKIIDKYEFQTNRQTTQWKFELDSAPALAVTNGAPARTHLRLKNSNNDYWYMITWNYTLCTDKTFPDEWKQPLATDANTKWRIVNNKLTGTFSTADAVLLGKNSTYTSYQFYTTSTSEYMLDLSNYLLTGTWVGDVVTIELANLSLATPTETLAAMNSASTGLKIKNGKTFKMTDSSITGITNSKELFNTYADTNFDSTNTTYVGRGALLQNTTTGEEREIEDFDTTSDTITLSTPFYTPPTLTDKFTITGRGADKRSSNNPAIQTLDYLTNIRYGKGLTSTDLDIDSFISSAKLCSARSNITVKLESVTGIAAADVFELKVGGSTNSGDLVAQGTVGSASTDIDTVNKTITLTNVLGKFTKAYSTYGQYTEGDIIYTTAGRYYRAASTVTHTSAVEPVHETGTTDGMAYIGKFDDAIGAGPIVLHKTAGNGTATTVNLQKHFGMPVEYELYDSDWVRYWRYYGWDRNNQAEVTRHQTNFILDTGKSQFANINSLLSHFNGILSYENGKYVLDVETQEAAPTISLNSSQENINPYYIENSDIIGKISLKDDSQKKGKNTIKSSVADPQNNWGSRSITFFNSDFLKADRDIVKTANFPFTGITNYWNGRIGVEKELFQSRFSKEISFTVGPRGLLLKVGQVIAMNYDSFGWSSKLFRIENLNFNANCTVSVKAREYDDSIYEITKQQALGVEQQSSANFSLPNINPPSTISTTTDKAGSVIITWTNGDKFKEETDSTEVYASNDNNRSNATLIATVDNAESYAYTTAIAGTKYYWVRHKRKSRVKSFTTRSAFFPVSATGGSTGTSTSISAGAVTVNLIPSSHVIDFTKVGTEASTITFTTETFNTEGTPYFEFLVGASTIGSVLPASGTRTIDSVDYDGDEFRLPQANEPGDGDAPVQVTVKVREASASGNIIAQDTVSIFTVKDGQNTVTGLLTNEAHVVPADNDGGNPVLTNSGGTFKVYYGNTLMKGNADSSDDVADSKISFSVASETGVDVSINENSGVYTVNSMSADSGTAVFSVTLEGSVVGGVDNTNDVTRTKTYTIAKAKRGTTGAGTAGLNNIIVSLYKLNNNSSTAPALPDGDGADKTSTYTFSTKALTETTSGAWDEWSPVKMATTVDNGVRWVTMATASSNTNTDTIAHGEWVTAIVDGDTPNQYAKIDLYQRNDSSSAPVKPNNALYYNFEEGALVETGTTTKLVDGNAALDSWKLEIPASGDYVHHISAVALANANATQDTIDANDWSGVVPLTEPGSSGAASKVVKLTSADYSIVYDEDGVISAPAAGNLLLTATTQNFDNPYFKFTGHQVASPDGTYINEDSPHTHNFTVPATFAGFSPNPSLVKVGVAEGNQTEVAFDTISIFAVKEGTNAITIFLTNNSHPFPAANNGTVADSDEADGATQIEAYRGATQLTFDDGSTGGNVGTNTYKVISATPSQTSGQDDITVAASTVNNQRVYTPTAVRTGSDSGIVTYVIKASGVNYTQKYSFSKSKKGDVGDEGKGTTTIYYLQTGWTNPGTPTAGTDETPGAWITTIPTAAADKSIWWSIGTKPAGSSTWTFTYPQFYMGDLDYTVPGIWNDEWSINLNLSGLGVLGLTDSNYANSQVPTITAGVGPIGSRPAASGLVIGSTYYDTTNNILYIATAAGTWSAGSITNNNELTNGTGFITGIDYGSVSGSKPPVDANNYSLPSGVLTGGSVSGREITFTSGGGNVVLTTQDTQYTLPTNVVIGTPSISGTTISFPRNGAGTIDLTTQDTQYANLAALDSTANNKLNGIESGATADQTAGEFDITGLAGFSADAYANANLEWGPIVITAGAAASNFSTYNGSTFNATNTTGTLSITHPSLGTYEATYTWLRNGTNIQANDGSSTEGFAITNTGSGNDAWTFSTATHSAATSITKTITHTASSNTIILICSILDLTGSGGGGGKCLTPAMLPEGLEIGDEVDSPEGKTKVVDIIHKQREGYYILEDELEITNDHPILIEGEWILAEEYQGKKEYIEGYTDVIYVETENELLTVKDWTVGGKY